MARMRRFPLSACAFFAFVVTASAAGYVGQTEGYRYEPSLEKASTREWNAKPMTVVVPTLAPSVECLTFYLPSALCAMVYKEVGVQLMVRGHLTDAVAHFNRAVGMDAESHEIFYSRAVALTMMKRYDLALLDVNRALVISPGVEARVVRAKIFMELRRFDEALGDITVLLSAQPHESSYWHIRGQLYRAMGNSRMSHDAFKNAEKYNHEKDREHELSQQFLAP
jgi:tetratricopeptide (TPR) repeat protein